MNKVSSIILSLILIISSSISLSGCSNYQKAEDVYTAVSIAINLAQGEIPNLVPTGLISQTDATAILNYVSLAGTFNTNYKACIDNAQNTMLTTSGKFVDCLGVFAKSLSDPATLAALRVISPKAQSKAQAYIAAIVAGVNIGLDVFKAGQMATPTVVAKSAMTIDDNNQFKAVFVSKLPAEIPQWALNQYLNQ